LRNRIALIAVILIALAGLYFINLAAERSAPNPDQQARDAEKLKQERIKIMAPAEGDEHDPLVTDAAYGDYTTAKIRATVGFTVNEQLAEHPSEEAQVADALKQWTQGFDFGYARIVCLDIPPDMRAFGPAPVPLGLTVNGKRVPQLDVDITPTGLTPNAAKFYLINASMPDKLQEINAYFRKKYGNHPSPGYEQ
jgi:hypothetical protein